MEQIYLDSLKLHDLNDGLNPYHIEPPIDGLSFTAMRIGSNPRAGDDGVSINSSYLGERRVALRGRITDVGTSAQHVGYRQALVSACAPTRDANGVIVLKTLRFKDLAGNQYRIVGEVIPGSMPLNDPRHSSFLIDFLSHSKYIEAFTASSLVIEPLTRGGFVLPVLVPIVFDEGTGGAGTAINTGDAPAYPVITLDGPLTNPRITNAATGEYIALTASISDGEQYVIDMLERTIVQGGVTNRMSSKGGGNFWALAPGNNSIILTTSVAGEAGQVSLSWRSAWYGV